MEQSIKIQEYTNKINLNLKNNIQTMLEFSELTARKLSLILGKNERYISHWLSEQFEINFSLLLEITLIFGLNLNLLCSNNRKFVDYYGDFEKRKKLMEYANNAWNSYKQT